MNRARRSNNLCATLTSDLVILAVYPYRKLTTGDVKHRVKIVPMQFVFLSGKIKCHGVIADRLDLCIGLRLIVKGKNFVTLRRLCDRDNP